MGSRLLPLSVALGALLADAAGLHRLAFYLLLLAVPGAAAAAFVAAADAFEARRAWPRAASTTLALTLLVTASAVRNNMPRRAAARDFGPRGGGDRLRAVPSRLAVRAAPPARAGPVCVRERRSRGRGGA